MTRQSAFTIAQSHEDAAVNGYIKGLIRDGYTLEEANAMYDSIARWQKRIGVSMLIACLSMAPLMMSYVLVVAPVLSIVEHVRR